MNKNTTTSYDVPAVSKAIRLIELLCESDKSLGVAEIVRALELNNNMVFRLLKTLQKEGWIIQEDEGPKYRMSLQAFHHISKSVGRMGLKTAALKPMKELWEDIGECTFLGILDGDKVLYINTLDPVKGLVKISVETGGRYVMHTASPGKVLLAYNPDTLEKILKAGLKKFTKNTICEPRKFREEMEKIRKNKYAIDIGEGADGLLCFAVPIFNYDNEVVASIGISLLNVSYTFEEMMTQLAPKVIKTGQQISQALGYCE